MKQLATLVLAASTAFAQAPTLDAQAAAQATAQPVAPTPTLDRVALSADKELARSIDELNALRAKIAEEKLPLAQELTALETLLNDLRKDQDVVGREVDAGNLEITTINAEIKARQEELVYVGNLLDEYARSFDGKVHPSELQVLGEAMATAKQASENTTLTTTEKFARQTLFVEMTVKRVVDAIGGMRFPGIGVDLAGNVATGMYAILGPVALFRGPTSESSGLVVPQTGSDKPLIRPLEGAAQAGILAVVGNGEGALPLDPSRGGALKALVQKTNIVHIFVKGGPIMWPLLVASILALGTVLERIVFLLGERMKRDPKALDAFFTAVTRGDTEEAIRVSKASKFYVVRALGYALVHKEQSLANALVYAQAQEMKRFKRGIPILDTVITLAPLLGLLGTVTGMMGSFSLIGGDLGAPGAITGGIAEALIATAFGLGIAITALLPFNFLNNRIDDAQHEIDSAAVQLELLVRPAALHDTVLHPAPPPQSSTDGHNTPHRPRELVKA